MKTPAQQEFLEKMIVELSVYYSRIRSEQIRRGLARKKACAKSNKSL